MTEAQWKRGRELSACRRTQARCWDWGSWALEVCGPPTGEPDGATVVLREALEKLRSRTDPQFLPPIQSLREWRRAAHGVEPRYRTKMAPSAARHLVTKVPHAAARQQVIEDLIRQHGKVTAPGIDNYLRSRGEDRNGNGHKTTPSDLAQIRFVLDEVQRSLDEARLALDEVWMNVTRIAGEAS